MGSLDKGSLDKAIQELKIKELEFINQGGGDNPLLLSSSTAKKLNIDGTIKIIDFIQFRDGTIYDASLRHNNIINRTYTFPDADITICGKEINNEFTSKQTMPQLDIINQGSGANPSLYSNSDNQQLGLAGELKVRDSIHLVNGSYTNKLISNTLTNNRVATFPDADITIVGENYAKYYLCDSFPLYFSSPFSTNSTTYVSIGKIKYFERPAHANVPYGDRITEMVILFRNVGTYDSAANFKLEVNGNPVIETNVNHGTVGYYYLERLSYDGYPANLDDLEVFMKVVNSNTTIEVYHLWFNMYVKLI